MKLYRGMNKRQYKKAVGAYWFKILVQQSKVRVGDVRSDCDGFNHVVTDIVVFKDRVDRSSWYVNGINFYYDDGDRMFCSCPIGCGPPESKEDIESYWGSHTDEYIENSMYKGWPTDGIAEKRDAARRGELVDERGIRVFFFN